MLDGITLLYLTKDGYVVFTILLCALWTGGVPHVPFLNGISFRFSNTLEILTPFAGILKWTFVHLAVELAANGGIIGAWNLLIRCKVNIHIPS